MNGLGERIRQYRMACGLSQEAFAARMEVSRQSVSKWENDMAQPELDRLLKMCEIFGVSMDTLVRGESMGEALPTEALETDICIETEYPHTTEIENEKPVPVSQARRIWGIGLCCTGAALLLLLTLLGGFLLGLAAAALFVLPGMYCLTVRCHLGLWIGWTYFVILDYFLLAATSGSRGLLVSAIQNPEVFSFANPIAIMISAGINLFLIVMLLCTLIGFRQLCIPADRKEGLLTGAVFLGWLAVKGIVLAVNVLLMRLVNAPALSYYLLFPLFDYGSLFLFLVFLVRLLAMMRGYRQRKDA